MFCPHRLYVAPFHIIFFSCQIILDHKIITNFVCMLYLFIVCILSVVNVVLYMCVHMWYEVIVELWVPQFLSMRLRPRQGVTKTVPGGFTTQESST